MKLLKDRFEHKAGTEVFEFIGHDYGCCFDDEQATGEAHVVVTLDPEGGIPFFTVPASDIG